LHIYPNRARKFPRMIDQAKPIKPPGIEQPKPLRDKAKGGFSLTALENLVGDCYAQPEWRARADLCCAYYDDKQLTPEQRHAAMLEGLVPRNINLIRPVINSVLGEEAKTRTDVKLSADDDVFADVSTFLSGRIKEATRETYSDLAISNGYAGQTKAGLGWVEVSRVADPLEYPYRVVDVHRNEIWYDWRAKDVALRDARWLVRKRWADLDEACANLPEFEELLTYAVNGWNPIMLADSEASAGMMEGYRNERQFQIRRDEWVETSRRRIKLYEVWYRVPVEVVVLRLSPTRRVPYDDNNPMHVEAVARHLVKVERGVSRQVRMALFAGPHRLKDVGTAMRHFPYVPFFAFRQDDDRRPYGMIDGMVAPQDEFNERRLRIQWMLKARQITVDSDALDEDYNTIEDLADMVMRPDMVVVQNPNRRNTTGFRVAADLSLQSEQFNVMNDSKQMIQEASGRYSTQLGNAPAGVTSGLAINSLMEAGQAAMGEMNDNYQLGRRLVHERLLDLIVEDHADAEMRVVIGNGGSKRAIVLNSFDPETKMPVNHVKDAPVKVGLAEVPNTPAFKMQQQQQIANIIGALAGNPAAVQVLTPSFIEATDLEDRTEVAKTLRKLSGLPQPGDQQGQAQAEQQQQQAAQAQAQAQQEHQAATIDLDKSTANLNNARAAEIGQRLGANQAQAQVAAQMPPQGTSEEDLIRQSLAEAMG
jgi:hypothetical protein